VKKKKRRRKRIRRRRKKRRRKRKRTSICNKGKCYKNNFILTKDISKEIILGTRFQPKSIH